jgi:hypothetical protein
MLQVMPGGTVELRVAEADAFIPPPSWVRRLLGPEPAVERRNAGDGLRTETAEGGGHCFVQALLAGAAELPARCFRRRVTEIYGELRAQLGRRRACHPIRFWNFVPGIGEVVEGGLARYEVFNAGRFVAFSDWYRTPRFGAHMVAASGVGHYAPDFVVQVLAAERPGRGLENPRQRPAYRYSRRYGPLPPCFARATLAATSGIGSPNASQQGLLLVAGTASIVDEDSRHLTDLPAQLAETCANLERLIGLTTAPESRQAPLERFRELRAYLPGKAPDEARRRRVVELLAGRFPNLEQLELVAADLCRPELLIELEGAVEVDLGHPP